MSLHTESHPHPDQPVYTGRQRSLYGLVGMVVLVGMGEHMAERFLPLYLQELTKASTAVLAIGVLAGMDDLLSALYSFPGGYLSDRLGTKRALQLFNALSMVGYLCVILIPTWWAVLLGAALFIFWSRSPPSAAPCCGAWRRN